MNSTKVNGKDLKEIEIMLSEKEPLLNSRSEIYQTMFPLAPVLTSEQPGHSASGISCSTSHRPLQSIHTASLAVPAQIPAFPAQPQLHPQQKLAIRPTHLQVQNNLREKGKDREEAGMQLHTYTLTRKAFQVSNSQ